MLWLLPTVALASGVMRPDVRFIDNRCTTRPADTPLTAPLYLTGTIRGATSAPGGPVHHHTFPLEAAHLRVVREGCTTPEPGRFAMVGQCGEEPMIRFRGTLQPGVRYRVGVPDAWTLPITTAGTATRGGCPGDPLAFGALDEKTFGETRVQTLTVPGAALRRDRPGRSVHLPVEAVADAVGLGPLYGPTGHMVADDFTVPQQVELQLSVRPYRHRYETEDEAGGVWCEQRDAALVEVAWPEHGFRSSLGWEASDLLSRRRGYCP